MVGVIPPSRIDDALDSGQVGQPIRKRGSRSLRLCLPQSETVKPPLREPAVEGGRREAERDRRGLDPLLQPDVPCADPSQHGVRMPGEELRDRVDHDVRAVVERPEPGRRGEGVVHHHERAGIVRRADDRRDVGDAEGRVGDDLDQYDPCSGHHDLGERGGVRRIGQGGLEAKARQFLRHQAQAAAIELVPSDHAVALFQKGHHHRRDRAHAGPRHPSRIRRALEACDSLREDGGVGMSLAAVGMALRPALVLIVQLVGRFRRIDHRHVQRRRDGAADAFGPMNSGNGGVGHGRSSRRATAATEHGRTQCPAVRNRLRTGS